MMKSMLFHNGQRVGLSESSHPISLERREQPINPISKPSGPSEDGGGPKRPDTESGEKDNLLKRMRKVDPKQAERYRQRTGE
ncbi:ubiquitin-like protein UBact [Nitrospira sp. M1]